MSDQPELDTVRRAALVARVYDLRQPPTFLSAPISAVARHTTDNLRIILFSPLFDQENDFPTSGREADAEEQAKHKFPPSGHWDDVQRLLTYVYVQATRVAQEMNRVLLDVDVLLKAPHEPFDSELIRDAERTYRVSPLPGEGDDRPDILVLQPDRHPHIPQHPVIAPPSEPTLPPLFPVAALGGTFDHLHAGHKILLSMGAWIARDKLIVGVTDDTLLKNKSFKDVLESIAVRTARVRGFLELFKPGLYYDVVAISDVYGPTAWDPNIQALVVSKETLPGAASIHKLRKEKDLSPLSTFVIDVISASEASLDDRDAEALKNTKMSSTFIRQWIVQTRGRSPEAPGSS
ncbi:Nucleotidylyl transferase [Fomitopsis serialis]|uniref:Nucleotidylyl transferase n=1 Tax=Fomitopsis serialis TaxID=139415 RepID=UPI002007E564|nr:Nucleotidylyl transferase [Neoantrodia serialis]KAH9930728.1 Nucleotidylyl transferase [Neoantrodia serialis]